MILFSNGWIADEDGKVYIYYASSDTRMHVAESTVDRLVDYCLHTPADGLRSIESVRTIIAMVDHNKKNIEIRYHGTRKIKGKNRVWSG